MIPSGESIRVVHPLFQEEGGGSIPTSPLQLYIGRLHYKTAEGLVREWHSRLPLVAKPETHYPCYGAEFGGRYFAAAMWGLPLAANRLTNGFARLVLRRFAIAPDAPKYTASRMLSVMTRMLRVEFPLIVGLLSYQDEDAHSGTIYKAAGWRKAARSVNSSWKRANRPSQQDRFVQSTSPKIRWELQLNRAKE